MASTSADVEIKMKSDNQEDDSTFDHIAEEPAADTQETTQSTSSQGELARGPNDVDEKALADYVLAQLLSGKSLNSSILRAPPFLRSLIEQPYGDRMLPMMNAFVKDVVENYQELHNPSTWSGDEAPNHGHAQHPTSLNELLVHPNDIFNAKFDTAVKIITSQANAAKKMLYRSRWLKSWQWDLVEAEAVREKEENPGAPQVRTIMGRPYDQHFAVKKSGARKSRQMKLWKTLSTLRRQQRYVIVLFRNSTINTALGDWLTPQIVDTGMNLYGVLIEFLLRRLEAEHHEQRDGAVEEELVMAGTADQDTWGEYHPYLCAVGQHLSKLDAGVSSSTHESPSMWSNHLAAPPPPALLSS